MTQCPWAPASASVGTVESTASNLDEVIEEIIATRISERGETRIDDKVTEAAMEDRKKNGYF